MSATETRTAKPTIETVLRDRYDADITAEAIVIEWAAETLADMIGVDKAAAQWRRVNGKRRRLGLYASIPIESRMSAPALNGDEWWFRMMAAKSA